MIHFYNSTSVAQREQVFHKSKEEIKQIAIDGAKLVKQLSEAYRKIRNTARFILGNLDGFATCLQLGLLPLAEAGLLNGDVMVNAITGSTGAGVPPFTGASIQCVNISS